MNSASKGLDSVDYDEVDQLPDFLSQNCDQLKIVKLPVDLLRVGSELYPLELMPPHGWREVFEDKHNPCRIGLKGHSNQESAGWRFRF